MTIIYCIKCGTQLPEVAHFCSNCGFRVPESFIRQQTEIKTNDEYQNTVSLPLAASAEETAYFSPIDTNRIEDVTLEMKAFIGHNSGYYLRKWSESSTPEKAVSWNWAAFFLTGYWLGYRKMYAYLFVWLIITISIFTTSVTSRYNHIFFTFILDLIVVGISIFMGACGNALYLRHTKKKIKKWHETPTHHSEKALYELGGTGRATVIILMAIHAIATVLIVTFLVTTLMNFGPGVTFGTGANASGVTGIQKTFNTDTPIFLQVNLGDPIGTDTLDIVLLKQAGKTETTVNKWSQKVGPDWDSFYFNFYNPASDSRLDPGHFIVRIYKGKTLLNEGEFDLKGLPFDVGSTKIRL